MLPRNWRSGDARPRSCHGLQAPSLVQEGPFKFSRNPIYLAFGVLSFGAALIFDSIYILVVLVIVLFLFDRVQIPREERYLQERFGEDYSSYRARVRRWI